MSYVKLIKLLYLADRAALIQWGRAITKREVLAEMKTDSDLKRIPVVILTTSESEQDIMQSYSLHANCYLTKPVGWTQFSQMIQQIEGFWMQLVKLPPR